jgi:hypothetical protein
MFYGLPWTSWLLMTSPVLGLALALRFLYVRGASRTPPDR